MTEQINTGNSHVEVAHSGSLWLLSIWGRVGIPEPRLRSGPSATRAEVLDTIDRFLRLGYILPETPASLIDSDGRARHGVVRDFRGSLKLPPD
jgi:hypothetical protein